MSKNVTLNGVTYNGVTNVVLPQAGGGEAVFSDGGGAATSMVLLETKTAANGDTYLKIDWQAEWNNYATFVLAFEDLEQTPSAYMRCGINNTSTTGGKGFYINGNTKFTTKNDGRCALPLVTINGSVYFVPDSTWQLGSALDMTSGYIRVTPVSATFVSGTFKLYGVR